MKPGDIIKVKLGGDVHEAKVIDCRNKKTIWVEVLWAKTRIHALTPAEKKKVAESPTSLEGLSENEKALALLAQAGKKLVHQSGAKRIKIPRAKVINAESFQPQERSQAMKVAHEKNYGATESTQAQPRYIEPIPLSEGAEELLKLKQELDNKMQEMCGLPTEQLSAKDRIKARLAAKK